MTAIYDIIICGGGAAGLNLTMELIDKGLSDLQILIIEQDHKNNNDRTWCFWDKESRFFDPLLTNTFSTFQFYSKSSHLDMDIHPYKYKMLRSAPFYKFIHKKIDQAPNITYLHESIKSISEQANEVIVYTNMGKYKGKQIFKGFLDKGWEKESQLHVSQHFKGWMIESKKPVFNPSSAIFMDFRIPQEGEIRFFYVLPVSEYEALVEIAIFSNEILPKDEYNQHIKEYIRQYLQIEDYIIKEEEFGIIPMTSYPFWKHNTNRILHIGTAGGAVKPSSGYAFKRIVEHSQAIAGAIEKGQDLKDLHYFFRSKFYFYDRTLLDVFLIQQYSGEKIFDILFTKNEVNKILAFLDGKTSVLEESPILTSLPFLPFFKGFVRQVFSYLGGK